MLTNPYYPRMLFYYMGYKSRLYHVRLPKVYKAYYFYFKSKKFLLSRKYVLNYARKRRKLIF
ncbi:hypothetical protein SULI_02930 [Saccharolobus solfataricus]|uniref:Uncharacterized protein n=2 Tax=Saccharolobus solfataricus TaxID=2287 RepID=A0A0E3K801_SACSO|nr:hypothetical protein [Saccharolobus solfataricus]AKA72971.1 hypothetical protein SULB_0574 [Saccharolobus solfataricus]AKA75670.1 hypothetical protein SULC_0572 [Saccharolobus solfataricus]AKA78363.1 hypothetical protein SULA_0572 [Saccharolobus solfataricus]AZF67482.1 hypothetical protein SULG_02930 [Saccharolobus solfataricus]AZF70102.1 hypothetical protein SULH_02930 [Saccharolobus solfataricus]